MWYAIVFRDHDGAWHAVETTSFWPYALIAHRATAMTLQALDYYDDSPPSVVKIIDASQTDYENAVALSGPVK